MKQCRRKFQLPRPSGTILVPRIWKGEREREREREREEERERDRERERQRETEREGEHRPGLLSLYPRSTLVPLSLLIKSKASPNSAWIRSSTGTAHVPLVA